MLSRRSWTSIAWYGARSICEYCLAATTRVDTRLVESWISLMSSSMSSVAEPADGAPGGRSPRAATWSRKASSSPAWTNAGASSQPSSTRGRRTSRPAGLRGRLPPGARACEAVATPARGASLAGRAGLERVRSWRGASRPAVARSWSRSRSASVARTAAAAGLLSSWVSPAESEPRASSRSRCSTRPLGGRSRRTALPAGAPPSGTTRASARRTCRHSATKNATAR